MAVIMDYAINLNATLAVRAEADYCSEMTTQMLFGEYCRILDENNGYFLIENILDKHVGWVAQNGLTILSEEDFSNIKNQPEIRVSMPMADIFNLNHKTIHRFALGSLIPNYNPDTSSFEIAGIKYQVHPSFISYLPEFNKEGVVPTALTLLNTPYLNGGKTIFGMDCSGFAQVVFSINGYILPRFSAHQSETGKTIGSIGEAIPGDLVFYTYEGVPSHTAIYLGNNKVIHAGECIKIETIHNETGDILDEDGKPTMKLYRIKRIG